MADPTPPTPPFASGASRVVDDEVEHLFRRQSGRLVAYLTRVFGPARLDLAEDVVQEALLKALQQWPFIGVPDNAAAWLLTVARNLALDRVRRDVSWANREADVARSLDVETGAHGATAALGRELADDELHLVFLCCHPAIPFESRVALTLKTAAGFSVNEIARALLTSPPTIAQRLVRAKRSLRDAGATFGPPIGRELVARLDAVLDVLYLMFNEGYAATEGERLIREDVCFEAIRLCTLVADGPGEGRPDAHALLAMMQLQAARLRARVDEHGELAILADQDRRLWDRRLIACGMERLARSASGDHESRYHLQAAIAAGHASAPSFAETDWPTMLELYDRLLATAPSPVVALNRVVALAHVAGARAALGELDIIASDPALGRYYLAPAVRGYLHTQLGDVDAARDAYEHALRLPCSEPERRLLERRLARLDTDA
ncbi:MAG: sigma-70 family RNA polymerase sigma factor [Vicinamibacterales bacterium]